MGGGVGGVIFSLHNDAPSLYHYDSRGDVIAQTDWNGNLTYQAGYLAFGQHNPVGNLNGSQPLFPGAWGAEEWTGTNATTDNLRDNTKEENDLGLVNQGQRYTNLQTDMFLTRDPLGFADGTNPQIYVHQNPYGHFDPEGLMTEQQYQADIAKAPTDAQVLEARYLHELDNGDYGDYTGPESTAALDIFNAKCIATQAARDQRIEDDKKGIADLQDTAKVLQEHGIDVDASQLDDAHGSAVGGDADTILLGNKLTPGQALYNDGKKAKFIKAAEDFAMMMVPGGSEEKAAEDVLQTAGEDAVSLVTRRGGATGAEGVEKAASRGLDDILKDKNLFSRWVKSSHDPENPLSPSDAKRVWDKLKEMGKTPRLDSAHDSGVWQVPHINVDGQHIPVDPGFTP
jgi:RHS repeat-associated protein